MKVDVFTVGWWYQHRDKLKILQWGHNGLWRNLPDVREKEKCRLLSKKAHKQSALTIEEW